MFLFAESGADHLNLLVGVGVVGGLLLVAWMAIRLVMTLSGKDMPSTTYYDHHTEVVSFGKDAPEEIVQAATSRVANRMTTQKRLPSQGSNEI